MKTTFIITIIIALSIGSSLSQDTFSIVAVDSTTGEVGSAGASCVDLFIAGYPTDDFIGVLIPGIGAINTQASYSPANQNNATNQMQLGQTPSQIIQWLVANDAVNYPEFRQYGIAAMINNSPEAAAYTGVSTYGYKNHIVGPNYAIQGNILLGQVVLDSMEARFLREDGDLACKLMAALQGANMVGADARCATNGTSSLYAFVKVAKPTDVFGSPSFIASVRTPDNAGIEPINSLQVKFDAIHQCGNLSLIENSTNNLFTISPNPTSDYFVIESDFEHLESCRYELYSLNGEIIVADQLLTSSKINMTKLKSGVYFIKIKIDDQIFTKKIIKE